MSDQLLYVSGNGAVAINIAQTINSHNLANVSTPGFKADLFNAESIIDSGTGIGSETSISPKPSLTDFSPGPLISTGRNLDVAIDGQGFFAVQMPDGSEAYTRAGNFQLNANGQLTTSSGKPIVGDGGPITIPPADSLSFLADGSINIKPSGQSATSLVTVGRLKLVNPDLKTLTKGEDGLFHLPNKGQAESDPSVRTVMEALEGSNVNSIDALVNMISLSRQFEMQVKMMHSCQEIGKESAQLLQT